MTSAEFPDDAADLLERHRKVIPNWVALYYQEPIELVRGEGTRVWDSSGKEYLDFFGGIVTTISGHAVEKIVDALREQAGKISHTSTLYLIRPMVELAEKLTAKAPIEPPVKAFFVGSGTEAVEAALLFATTYRRSNEIIALRNSYLGRGRGDDLRAHPGRRRVRHAAARVLRDREGHPRRVRDPVHLRRGPDRVRPHRRDVLGDRGVRRPARRHGHGQGPRQRHGHGRRARPPGDRRLAQGQLDLDVRRQPAVLDRGAGEPRAPRGGGPPAQRPDGWQVPDGRAARPGRAARGRRRGPGQGPDARRRAGEGPGDEGTRRRRRRAGHGGREGARPAD